MGGLSNSQALVRIIQRDASGQLPAVFAELHLINRATMAVVVMEWINLVCYCQRLRVWLISGSRVSAWFLIELGATMIVASTIVPILHLLSWAKVPLLLA
jgi:hypothetical protein